MYNYGDGIIQVMRRSVVERLNANRHAKEETRDGERAMEMVVEAAAGNTKLRLE